MANSRTWNIQLADGGVAQVEIFGNRKVSINGSEAVKLKDLLNKEESSIFEKGYDLPLGNGEVAKYYIQNLKTALTYNGIDIDTGKEHTPFKVPGWLYVFFVLYCVDFFAFLGGALGGILYVCAISLGYNICKKPELKTSSKVLFNTLIYIAATVIGIVVAVAVSLALN